MTPPPAAVREQAVIWWERQLWPDQQAAAEQFLRDHPEAPAVASAEGRILGVRYSQHRYGRRAWESQIQASAELRGLVTCHQITGLPPNPGTIQHAARIDRQVGWLAKVGRFLTAVTGPHVSDEAFEQRLAACSANTCGKLRVDGEKRYCGACGCGKWRLAELSTKLRFARLECPQGIWTNDKLTTREIDDTQGDLHGEV